MSDPPSASATNAHGSKEAMNRLGSILCHPLGLPLLCAFHGKDPSELPCLAMARKGVVQTPKKAVASRQPSRSIEDATDNVLSGSILEWRRLGEGLEREMKDKENIPTTQTKSDPSEDQLTRIIARKITELRGEQVLGYYAHNEVPVKDTEATATNILLSPSAKKSGNEESTTPFAVIEFGLAGGDWSKKLDQNIKFLDKMVSGDVGDTLQFKDPILFGVITIEDDPDSNHFEMKIGVFLCCRRDLEDKKDEFLMSLLWHTKDQDLFSASKSFGRLLRVTNDFSSWVKQGWPEEYQCLSPSCCLCKYQEEQDADYRYVVLRSYDNRVRTSTRNPEIYLDQNCQDRVGVGTTTTVFELEGGFEELDEQVGRDSNALESSLWEQLGKRGMKIISTPYREGVHFAKAPVAFVPIVEQLRALHAEGYVHGDIRAFNMVFGDKPGEGWLIDFDYGGKDGVARYPKGYEKALADGSRLGSELHVIMKWQDWFALGHLIFVTHTFESKEVSLSDEYHDVRRKWIKGLPEKSPEDIEALLGFLRKVDPGEDGYVRSAVFQQSLDKMER